MCQFVMFENNFVQVAKVDYTQGSRIFCDHSFHFCMNAVDFFIFWHPSIRICGPWLI